MAKSRYLILLALITASVALPLRGNAQTTFEYHLLKKTVIGGEGGWDCLRIDALRHHLFIAHSSLVDVYDLDRDSVVAHIPHTDGAHDIAIASAEGHGFISCGKSNSVLMFDLRTFDTLRRMPVGEKPDAMLYDPATKHVFVMNGKSENITILDAKSGDPLATINLPGAPEFAVADGRGHVFVNLEDKSLVVKLDSRKNRVLAKWGLGKGEGPTGIAIDPREHVLFVGCANQKFIILDSKDGEIIDTQPIGKGVDGVGYDGRTSLAFSSNGDGTVNIFSAPDDDWGQAEETQSLLTQRGARTMALDPTTHNLYLVSAEFGLTPAATTENPHPRPSIVPGTFSVLKYGLTDENFKLK